MDNQLFIDNIKSACRKQGISVRQLELSLDMGSGSISRFKTTSPSITRVAEIAEKLQVSIDYLVYGQVKNDININDENTELEDNLILEILNKTKTNVDIWQQLTLNSIPNEISNIKKYIVNEVLYLNYDIFYINLDEGYYILSAQYNDKFNNKAFDLKLISYYKGDKAPVVINSVFSDLFPIYKAIEENKQQEIRIEHSEKLRKSFFNKYL